MPPSKNARITTDHQQLSIVLRSLHAVRNQTLADRSPGRTRGHRNCQVEGRSKRSTSAVGAIAVLTVRMGISLVVPELRGIGQPTAIPVTDRRDPLADLVVWSRRMIAEVRCTLAKLFCFQHSACSNHLAAIELRCPMFQEGPNHEENADRTNDGQAPRDPAVPREGGSVARLPWVVRHRDGASQ